MMEKIVASLTEAFAMVTPPINPRFAGPASPAELDRAEAALGLKLPSELRDLLLCVNGQSTEGMDSEPDPILPLTRFGPTLVDFSGGGWLLGVNDIVDQTLWYRQYVSDVQDEEVYECFGPARFHDAYIILNQSGNPARVAIDLAPEPGGTVGQIVAINDQPNKIAVLAPSLSAFLESIADGFKSGRFVWGEVFEETWSDR